MKALFIPLKTKYWNEFVFGTKTYEYRLDGPRWNSKTCFKDRPVVLSKGYGKKHRMRGIIRASWLIIDCDDPDFVKLYGKGRTARVIEIKRNLIDRAKLIREIEPVSKPVKSSGQPVTS